jgi:hypothetical protein
MKPQLIIDFGDAALSALLVTADGEQVQWSQEIQQIAVRHVSPAILFEPRVVEDSGFIWDDVLETLSKASPQTFFQRARRIGLRRPWDPLTTADALQLASPLTVLSSPAALVDRHASRELARVALVLLEALLDPIFAFVAERQLPPSGVDSAVIVSSRIGYRARLVLQKLFRIRGFRPPAIISREIAAAMSLARQTPCACVVAETSDSELHLHRVTLEDDAQRSCFRTTASVSLPGLGWNHWSARIAEAANATPSTAFERSLIALLTASPESLPPQITHGALLSALGDAWIQTHSLTERLSEPIATLAAENLPLLFAGEIFTLAPVRALFAPRSAHMPTLGDVLPSVAGVMRSQFRITAGGGLRIATFRGPSQELLSSVQLPAAGETCRAEADFRIAGSGGAGQPLLIHLLVGEATLCALPLDLGGDGDLRLTLCIRRNSAGSRLHGTVEARTARDVAGRCRFDAELEVTR